MEYILLAVIIYAILFNAGAIILITAYRPSQRPISRQNTQTERIVLNDTQCRACNVLLVNHNHGCNWDDLKQIPIVPDTTPDISATIADVENYLLSEFERYRDAILELKALPVPVITHTDGDTDNTEISNLTLENKPVNYELPTSGLVAGQPYNYDKSISWEHNIRIWENRIPVEYPEGYEQGIVLFQDDKPIYKSTSIDSKCGFKKLIRFEKAKKTRKSKIGVC